MKRKKFIIIGIIIISIIVAALVSALYLLFDAQYNMRTGVSSIMNITLDEEQEKMEIGNLDGYHIFAEGLNVKECYFITISNEKISMTDAVNEGKVSVKDMTRKAFGEEEMDDKTVYYYENYLIEVTEKEVLFKNK